MKTFIFSLVLFIIIVSLLVFNFFSIQKKSNELKNILQKLEDSIKDENEENINKYLEKASVFWKEKNEALFVVSNHRDLDELSQIFERLKIRIKQKIPSLGSEFSYRLLFLIYSSASRRITLVFSKVSASQA